MSNTIHQSGTTLSPVELATVEKRANSMESRMKEYFEKHPMSQLTAEDCHKIFGGLLTSVRRSLSNLVTRDVLTKDQKNKKEGSYKVKLCTFSLKHLSTGQVNLF